MANGRMLYLLDSMDCWFNMDWIEIVSLAIGGTFVYFMAIYIWHKLDGKKINFKDYKFYISMIILVVIGTALNYFAPTYLKMILIIVLFFIVNYTLVSRKLDKCITSIIVSQGIVMVCELVIVLFMSIFIGDKAQNIAAQPYGIITLNIGVAALMFLIIKTSFPQRIYKWLLVVYKDMERNSLIFYSALTVTLATSFMIMSYTKLPFGIVLACNTVLVLFYVFILIRMANVQKNLREINNKYETSLTSLKEYEHIMDKCRVDNHENKNELLIIRNMVKAKDDKVVNHIDKIINNKINDNEEIFYKASKIPEGGLRAIIYSKVCKIEELNINYVLDIANDVRTVDLINMEDETVLNICKVVGVFLDNAIEAVDVLNKKQIRIELYILDNDLIVEIGNNYEGVIDLDKLDNLKYTTKGDGHGYGLSLVSRIIKHDNNLENEKEIINDMFVQRLKIKM